MRRKYGFSKTVIPQMFSSVASVCVSDVFDGLPAKKRGRFFKDITFVVVKRM